MRLLSMKLENFQGVKTLSLEFPGGCSGSIYGDNGTGKTTVFNALTWLLFDKASTGVKDFSPKTKGVDSEWIDEMLLELSERLIDAYTEMNREDENEEE